MAIILCEFEFMEEKFGIECQDDFDNLTNQQVADIANNPDNREEGVDVFKSVKDLEAAWRTEELFDPRDSYMRVIPNKLLTQV